jgi:chemotaxis protein MotB
MEAIAMARMFQFFGIAALGFALTGCVANDKYSAVKLENEALRAQLGDAQTDARAKAAQAESYKNQLALLSQGTGDRDGLINNLTTQNAALQAQLAEINAKYEKALNTPGVAALPEVVTNALNTFAAQNPDLVDFDAARGIVKFKTDFTFALGSDQVTPKAKEAIGRFAQILNSEAAKGYELMVAGHTDNTPVSNPATKARHPDNWYLSSHRAISVGDELIKHQVGPQRIAVVGYGDQRPIASNTTTAGKAQNRRVEVLILPSTVRSSVAGKTNTATPTGSNSKKPAPGLNKDTSVSAPTGPALNK